MDSFSFGSNFPASFFQGHEEVKKEFLATNINSACLESCKRELNALIASAAISTSSKEFCYRCFSVCPAEFFYMPTSTTGKYHGGQTSSENSVGGNIVHTGKVLGMCPRVLRRYESFLGVDFQIAAEALRVGCILHDICKVPAGSIWSLGTHGEAGAELVRGVEGFKSLEFGEWVAFAIGGHMYLWRFADIWNMIINSIPSIDSGVGTDIIGIAVGFMLSECDYYSI